MLREQRIGRANLTAAFPEKSPEEIERILTGVWDNLGRIGAEFAHLDHIWEHDPYRPENSRIEIEPRTHELFAQLRLDGKPALISQAISATGSCLRWPQSRTGSTPQSCIAGRTSIRRSRNQQMRAVNMGTLIPAGRDAPLSCRSPAKRPARRHAGRPVFHQRRRRHVLRPKDQGQSDAGAAVAAGRVPDPRVRIIRLPGHRFRAELSEEVKPVRDATGQIDIQGTIQAVTSVVEGWIREYPDQWLWLHAAGDSATSELIRRGEPGNDDEK